MIPALELKIPINRTVINLLIDLIDDVMEMLAEMREGLNGHDDEIICRAGNDNLTALDR